MTEAKRRDPQGNSGPLSVSRRPSRGIKGKELTPANKITGDKIKGAQILFLSKSQAAPDALLPFMTKESHFERGMTLRTTRLVTFLSFFLSIVKEHTW